VSGFLLVWLGAFGTLVVGLGLLLLYFRTLGSDLELNSRPAELMLALVTSAAQSEGYWAMQSLLTGLPASLARAHAEMVIPICAVVLFYKLAHLMKWDQYEVLGLLSFQIVVYLIASLLVDREIGAAVFVLSAFAMALVLIGGAAKQV
jgi:hypothetical protein